MYPLHQNTCKQTLCVITTNARTYTPLGRVLFTSWSEEYVKGWLLFCSAMCFAHREEIHLIFSLRFCITQIIDLQKKQLSLERFIRCLLSSLIVRKRLLNLSRLLSNVHYVCKTDVKSLEIKRGCCSRWIQEKFTFDG